MTTHSLSLAERAQQLLLNGLMSLPSPLQRLLAGGRPTRVDGLTLDADVQLLLLVMSFADLPSYDDMTVAEVRQHVESGAAVIGGHPIDLRRVEDLTCAGADGDLAARLYVPHACADGGGLLVYYHGGGWVVGSLDSHDQPCRFLAEQAGVKVLSVDYRMAPECPFPAASDDALAAFRWALANAEQLAIDPARIAVGGDSAGGNLAASVSLRATRDGGPSPAFQLPIYPVTDLSARSESYHLFADGFFLTASQMEWYIRHYSGGDQRAVEDPSASPLLAEDLSGLPPAYIATAGFDPLRDEGEAYARRLEQAGVPVTLRRVEGQVHGFANTTQVSRGARAAMAEAAAALAAAIA
jgi:acetyl esterase